MAQIIVRKLDDGVKETLRRRATHRGRSLEAEVRDILSAAVARPEAHETKLGSQIASRFSALRFTGEFAELRGHAARPADLTR